MDSFLTITHTVTCRKAAEVCNQARRHSEIIRLEKNGKQVDCKSFLGLLSLNIMFGDSIRIIVDGENEEYVLNEISQFLRDN